MNSKRYRLEGVRTENGTVALQARLAETQPNQQRAAQAEREPVTAQANR
ncbi:MAG: hypothetical protein GYB67_16210 [Chloroflexi bacterium]|nr:hypothetical protein [Chloroflexota bacterium]